MIYIRKINENEYQLGGQVATAQMIKEGWIKYDGPVPKGGHFRMVNGELEAFEPKLPVETQITIYKEYLKDTDYKMLPGYVPKEGESLEEITQKRNAAREFIRENEISREVLNP